MHLNEDRQRKKGLLRGENICLTCKKNIFVCQKYSKFDSQKRS